MRKVCFVCACVVLIATGRPGAQINYRTSRPAPLQAASFLNGDDIFLFEHHFFIVFLFERTKMIAQEFQPALHVIYS
jgi:hypothetical protein